jgi:preprotein translocase subunit SecG
METILLVTLTVLVLILLVAVIVLIVLQFRKADKGINETISALKEEIIEYKSISHKLSRLTNCQEWT